MHTTDRTHAQDIGTPEQQSSSGPSSAGAPPRGNVVLAVFGGAAAATTALLATTARLGILGTAVVASALIAAGWWVLARNRAQRALHVWSFVTLALAVAGGVLAEPRWQLAPWQAVALLAAVAAGWRIRRPEVSRSWGRTLHRAAISGLVLLGAVALQFAAVPLLPAPTGPRHVGTQIFSWTDPTRPETMTAYPADSRRVVAQAWYPSDTTAGPPADYVATDTATALIDGLPTWFFTGYDEVTTHAYWRTPVSTQRDVWPVLVFSPGLNVARQANTALCVELASRGYVVVALSHPYDSAATQLADHWVVDPATHVTVDDFSEVPGLVETRAADASFALDELASLMSSQSDSPLVGHLDLDHVGIFGHSTGGATAVAATAADERFDVGANLDGRLFGKVPRLHTPFLWVEDSNSAEPGQSNALMRRSRDALQAGLRAEGGLVSIAGISHMGFTDEPAYLTPIGRHLLGGLRRIGTGTRSVEETAPLVADILTGFMGPYLNGADNGDLRTVDARHDALSVTVSQPTHQ